jgi:hypothetical protein
MAAAARRRVATSATTVAVVALLVAACGATAISTPLPAAAPDNVIIGTANPDPIYSPSPTATEAETSLLASMAARYDDCSQSQSPNGTLVADIACTTVDGVRVDGAQFASAAAASAAFKAQAGAKKGTRCSAGAYLGNYKVGGKTTGQLGCNGTAATVAWTVPTLRLYLSAYNLSMPALYAWWQHHWTVGSVSSAATTGEKAVPVPVAVVDTPEPAATPESTDAPIPVLTGISDADVLAAGTDAGLDCQNDAIGITCSATTSLGTDLELSSTGTGDGVQEVGITSTGEATEGHSFLVAMARALLGSRASTVLAWVGANEASSVVDKTFGPYYITYRGPLDMVDLSIQPAG